MMQNTAGASGSNSGYPLPPSRNYSVGNAHTPRGSSRVMPAGPERIETTRKVSSTIVSEQWLQQPPQDLPTREIEVPGQTQEEIKYVPRKQVVEVEKRVPKYEYEYIDRIVEIPRIEYVDRYVEVPQIQEVVREVKVPRYVDVPKEVIKEVKVPKKQVIEQMREVPGEIIEVPKPYPVENPIHIARYTDRKIPLIVAQTVRPIITEGASTVDVDVYVYEAECVPVDVHILKPVSAQLQSMGAVETTHRIVTVSAAQYNTMLKQLNMHLSQEEITKLPYLSTPGGPQFLSERVSYAQVASGTSIIGFDWSEQPAVHTQEMQQTTTTTTQQYAAVERSGGATVAGGATSGYAVGGSTTGYSIGGTGYPQAGGYSIGGGAGSGGYSVSTGTTGYSMSGQQQYSVVPHPQQYTAAYA